MEQSSKRETQIRLACRQITRKKLEPQKSERLAFKQ